jgi:hypothetical protein
MNVAMYARILSTRAVAVADNPRFAGAKRQQVDLKNP